MNNSENQLIRRIRATASTPAGRNSAIRVGIGDDAALFSPRRGYETILTCDWFLEGAHFLRAKHPADSVGWKCLARAISDIAAMGGAPRCFLLSLALPESHTARWLDGFLEGLHHAVRKFKCPLAGGDITRRQEILINVTVIGEVQSGRALLRSGARAGDILYVSGRLGEAELGLRRLRSASRIPKNDPALKKHLYPEPRIALGRWLADHQIATSLMDLSDGLSTDLPRLCAASEVGAQLEASRIPAVQIASRPGPRVAARPDQKKFDPLEMALNGGDDYELLFTVRSGQIPRLPPAFQGTPLTAIGEITRDRSITVLSRSGRVQRLRASGWDPFKKR